jgi:signal transduction histidine kinase
MPERPRPVGIRRAESHGNGVAPSERARFAARIQQLTREKEAAEGFAAVAAHELVEPLIMTEALVAMLTERLERGDDENVVREIELIGRTIVRARMTAEVLLHERRAAGRRALHTEPVDLAAVVDECVRLIEHRLARWDARVVVGPLPTVRAEPVLAHGLYFNLLVNALRYGQEGGTIELGGEPDGSFWRLWVSNDGPLIAPEDRHRIFAPFERGTGEQRLRGSGLGLVICRRIAERHGGRIGVEAVDGRNRFWFTLPAA